ncbi:MAG: hypothetical protein AAF571_10470 [Verrucomicrobiota bacterium]
MTPEKQRIAIAEACIEYGLEIFFDGGGIPRWKKNAVGFNPLNDLNAMHEAEKVLEQDYDILEYNDLLDCMSGHQSTAAQRAEAFLKTISKWEAA